MKENVFKILYYTLGVVIGVPGGFVLIGSVVMLIAENRFNFGGFLIGGVFSYIGHRFFDSARDIGARQRRLSQYQR